MAAFIGANGFHLPFNPATAGANYTTGAVVTNNQETIENLFDGDPSTSFGANTGANSKATAQLSTTITANSSFLYRKGATASGQGGPCSIGMNGAETYVLPAVTDAPSARWFSSFPIPANDFPIDFNYITTQTSGEGSGTRMIEVDGEILVDHSAIGTDASGQGNHFADENFAAGNTDEIWSKNALAVNIDDTTYLNMFNGNLNDGCNSTGGGAIATLNTSAWGFSDCLVEIYAIQTADTSATINGIPLSNSQDDQRRWFGTTVTGPFNSITWGASAGYTLRAIRVNGEVIVDKNIQDTQCSTRR